MISTEEGPAKQRSRRGCVVTVVLAVVGILVVVALCVIIWAAVYGLFDQVTDDPKDDTDDQKPVHTWKRFENAIKSYAEGNPYPRVSVGNFSNWDRSVRRESVMYVKPQTLEQITYVLKASKKLGLKVRAVSNKYSFSDVYAEEMQVFLDTSMLKERPDMAKAMQRIIHNEQSAVRVLAGISVGELVDFMVAEGVQFLALPVIRNAQVGAALATCSLGGGQFGGVIGEYLVAATLVNADGEVKHYNESSHPETMAALRCCVGMCGIFYDLVFKVDPLIDVKSTNYWEPTKDVIKDGERVKEMISTGDLIGHWAPLTGWSDDEWDTYAANQTFPHTYDPWEDLVWLKHSIPQPSNSRKKRFTSPPDDLPTFYGGGNSMRVKRSIDYKIMVHKWAYDYEYRRTAKSNNTVGPYPDRLVRYDADAPGVTVIREIGFAIRDNSGLQRGKSLYTDILQSIKKWFDENRQMPLLTIVNRWIKPSLQCYLCPNHFDMVDGNETFVATMSLTFDDSKTEFAEWFHTIFPTLREKYPDMRLRWPYIPNDLNNVADQVKKSLKESGDLEKFAKAHNEANFDPHSMFLNDLLEDVFGTAFLGRRLQNLINEQARGQGPLMSYGPFHNWDTSVKRRNVYYVKPKHLDEIQFVIKAAKAIGMKVSAVSGKYSYSDVYGEENQLYLDTSDLRRRKDERQPLLIESFNGQSAVRVLAGISVGELVDFMVAEGVQFLALPVIRNAQVGAVLATCSQGGGQFGGVMGEYLVAATLVNADGEVKHYNESSHPETMAALRCCVGMCGIFYDLVFKVDPLIDAKTIQYWEPFDAVINDQEKLKQIITTGDYIGFWAPLTGLTNDEWATYQANQTFPGNYDPLKDLLWYKHTIPEPFSPRRKRSTAPPEGLPAFHGGINSARVKRDIDYKIMIHKWAYDFEYARTVQENNTVGPYPDRLVRYDASAPGATVIREVGLALRDNYSFQRSQNIYKKILQHIKSWFDTYHQMPVLSIVNRWMKPSLKCYLCPNQVDLVDGNQTIVFTTSLTFDASKTEFIDWFNQVFPNLRESFPDIRLRWAYMPNEFNNLVEQAKDSLTQSGDMAKFLKAFKQAKIDSHSLFMNKMMQYITKDL